LSAYTVKLGANGGAWGNDTVLTGTLQSGDVLVIYNSSASADIIAVGDIASDVTYFNGDDAIGLFKNGELIDIIGTYQSDPGTAWDVAGVTNATLDHTIVRKDAVTVGNTDWTASSGTTADNSEWVVYAKDDISHLGWHINKPTSTKTDITAFAVAGQQGSSVINTTNHTVDFNMPTGTNLNGLVPTITISDGATISPASGVARDFTSPVTYTVTAEDGTTVQTWTVTAHLVVPEVTLFEDDFEAGNLNKWTAVSVKGDQIWAIDGTHGVDGSKCAKMSGYSGGSFENEDWLIASGINLSNVTEPVFSFYSACNYTGADITVKYSTNYSGSGAPSAATWTDLTATLSAGSWAWTSSGDIDLSSINSSNLSIAIVYTSTAAESKTWEIDNVVIKAKPIIVLNTETDITGFSFAEQFAPATINATAHTVNIQVVHGTSLTSLSPVITLSEGATINPASGVARDFTNPVTYTVTAEDVAYTQVWTVTVTEAAELSHAADFLTFALAEEVAPSVINLEDTTVTCTVAQLEDLTTLTPSFTASQSAQVSPTATVVDFTNPVEYTITAQDGTTKKHWMVTVNKASNEAAIKAFTMTGISGEAVIDADAHTVKANVVAGTALTAVEPTITISAGATITPTGAQDLSAPKVYTVVSEEKKVSIDWTVTITKLPADLMSIHDVQYTADASGNSPYNGKIVRIEGVVTAVDLLDNTNTKNNFFVQDAATELSGIYVYSATQAVAVGNKVEIEGTISEYKNLTEISYVTVTVKENSATLPAAIEVAAIEDLKAEKYEGVLVKLPQETACNTATVSGRNWSIKNEAGDTLQVRNQVYN